MCVLCAVMISRSKLRINICDKCTSYHNYLQLAYSLELQLNGGEWRHNDIAFYGS